MNFLLPSGHNQKWLTGPVCRYSQDSCVHTASHLFAFLTPSHLRLQACSEPHLCSWVPTEPPEGCCPRVPALRDLGGTCPPSRCSRNAKGSSISQSHRSGWRPGSRCGAESSRPAWSRGVLTMSLLSSVSWSAVLRSQEIMTTPNYEHLLRTSYMPRSVRGCILTLRGRGPRLAEAKSLYQDLTANQGQIWDAKPRWVTTVLSCLSWTSREAPKSQLMGDISNHLIFCVSEWAINGWHLKIKIDIIRSIKIMRWVGNGTLRVWAICTTKGGAI